MYQVKTISIKEYLNDYMGVFSPDLINSNAVVQITSSIMSIPRFASFINF